MPEKALLAKVTSVVKSSSTKVRPITLYSSRHLSPSWNTHSKKRGARTCCWMPMDLLLPDMAAFFILSYYIIWDFYLPKDELVSLSFSPSCFGREFVVTGLRMWPVQQKCN